MTDTTPDGMPVISQETFATLGALVLRETKKSPVGRDFARQLEHENPVIYHVLEQLLDSFGECEYCDGVGFGIYATYELLRRQSAANRLHKSYQP